MFYYDVPDYKATTIKFIVSHYPDEVKPTLLLGKKQWPREKKANYVKLIITSTDQ